MRPINRKPTNNTADKHHIVYNNKTSLQATRQDEYRQQRNNEDHNIPSNFTDTYANICNCLRKTQSFRETLQEVKEARPRNPEAERRQLQVGLQPLQHDTLVTPLIRKGICPEVSQPRYSATNSDCRTVTNTPKAVHQSSSQPKASSAACRGHLRNINLWPDIWRV